MQGLVTPEQRQEMNAAIARMGTGVPKGEIARLAAEQRAGRVLAACPRVRVVNNA